MAGVALYKTGAAQSRPPSETMLLSSAGPTYAKDPFAPPRTDSPAEPHVFASALESAASSLASLRSWTDSAPSSPPQPPPKTQPRRTDPPRPTTTFTFLLFGATSAAALIYILRTRRAMKSLQAGTSGAFRDARAWRKVALNLTKLNGTPALPLDMLHSAREAAAYGQRIETELVAARKTVAAKREAIKQADAAEAARTGGFWHTPVRTAFSFGKHAPHPAKKHAPDGVSLRSASVCPPVVGANAHLPAKPAARKLSAREKWCRVAGISAAQAPASADVHEDWIGDVTKAIQQRDAAADDYLLPVSDLNIATGRRTEDEPQPNKEARAPAYEYPISNEYKDMEDIFMAAWDDGYSADVRKNTGPVNAPQTASSNTDRLVENEIPIHWLRSADIADDIAQQLDRSRRFKAARPEPELEAEEVVLTEYTTEEPEQPPSLVRSTQELTRELQAKDEEVQRQRSQIRELSERVEGLQDMCHELEDEGQRRAKALRKQMAELEQQLGLMTVWAEGIHRRLGLESPPMSASLRKPHA